MSASCRSDDIRFGERFQEQEPPSTLLFFSRTIGLSEDGREIPIIGGVKVTGKSGRYDLGFLDIFTDRTSYREDEEQVDIRRTNFSVFRLKRDVFEKSSIGIMALSKDSVSGAHSDYNRAGGRIVYSFTPDFYAKAYLQSRDEPSRRKQIAVAPAAVERLRESLQKQFSRPLDLKARREHLFYL